VDNSGGFIPAAYAVGGVAVLRAGLKKGSGTTFAVTVLRT